MKIEFNDDLTYVLIDMPMPTDCMSCHMSFWLDDDNHICPIGHRRIIDSNTRPDWCPIKHVIKIKRSFSGYVNDDVDK